MRVLIACEFSGVVRDAFIAQGHDAVSCDILDTESPGPHIKGDVSDVLGDGWDLMIAHPPCTYLCSMGLWWLNKRPERRLLTEAALRFVETLLSAPIPRIALENPVGLIGTRIRKSVQPWMFGDAATKRTCLWLSGLQPLTPTRIVDQGEFYLRKSGRDRGARMLKWSHITSGTRKSDRARIASQTFPGIAHAMADQWSDPDLWSNANGSTSE